MSPFSRVQWQMLSLEAHQRYSIESAAKFSPGNILKESFCHSLLYMVGLFTRLLRSACSESNAGCDGNKQLYMSGT